MVEAYMRLNVTCILFLKMRYGRKGFCEGWGEEIYARRKAEGMNLLLSLFMKQKPKFWGWEEQVALRSEVEDT